MIYVQVSEILHEYQVFQSEYAYPYALPYFPAIIGGIEGGFTAHIQKYGSATVQVQ